MSLRSGSVFYWLCTGVAALLVAAALLWNGWTFSQHSRAQGQLKALGVEVSEAPAADPAPGSPEAAELELLLDADRRGIVEENFLALLAEPQKRALAVARRDRLNDRADERKTSLIFGVILILGGVVIFGVARRYRPSA
jgi:hypothetical protein